jgi:hypothetical protein
MFTWYMINLTGDTHDIIWLKWMFYSKPMIKHDFAVIDDDAEVSIPPYKAGESNDQEEIADTNAPSIAADVLLGERSKSDDEDSKSMASATIKQVPSTRSGRMIN